MSHWMNPCILNYPLLDSSLRISSKLSIPLKLIPVMIPPGLDKVTWSIPLSITTCSKSTIKSYKLLEETTHIYRAYNIIMLDNRICLDLEKGHEWDAHSGLESGVVLPHEAAFWMLRVAEIDIWLYGMGMIDVGSLQKLNLELSLFISIDWVRAAIVNGHMSFTSTRDKAFSLC